MNTKRFKDITGNEYGLLTVLSHAGKNNHSINLWLCSCKCGGQQIVTTCALKAGKTRSCGCQRYGADAMRKKSESMKRYYRQGKV